MKPNQVKRELKLVRSEEKNDRGALMGVMRMAAVGDVSGYSQVDWNGPSWERKK